MPTLSLAMIVKNEEANLLHCLGSVEGLVDEIVILDTGSTDRTLEIASSFGAIIGHFQWCNDFAAARNAALGLCTQEWVLVLDADEAVDRMDHAVIRDALQSGGAPAFCLPVRSYVPTGDVLCFDQVPSRNTSSYTEGSSCSYFVDVPLLRLCRNFPDLAFRGAIHEILDGYFQAKGLPVGTCPAVIHHYGKLATDYDRSKQPLYLAIAEKEAARTPGNAHAQFLLLMQAKMLEDWKLVLKAFRAFQKLEKHPPAFVLIAAAEARLNLGNPAEALPLLERVLRSEPRNTLARHVQALALVAVQRPREAMEALQKAIASNPGFAPSVHLLSSLEYQAGWPDRARATLRDGLGHSPANERLYRALIKLDLDSQQNGLASRDAQEALQVCPNGGEGIWHWLAAVGMLAQGQSDRALAFLEQGLRIVPDHAGLLRLRNDLTRRA
jgi:tetratricopeptide (TPR) repeat protein